MSITFPGTAGVKFEWEYPEPPDVVYQLVQLENYLENTVVLAESAKEVLIADMTEKFETETDPQGRAWEELVAPEPQQIGILRRGSTDAAMYNAAISAGAWDATPVGVFFDTSALPSYWVFHEQPTGGAQRIPQRAFIDASTEAQVEVEAIGARWLETGVRMAASLGRASLVTSPTTGRFIASMGQTTIIGGVARRQVRDPATGKFVSTRPEFYA